MNRCEVAAESSLLTRSHLCTIQQGFYYHVAAPSSRSRKIATRCCSSGSCEISMPQSKTPPKWQKNDLVSGAHGPAWPSWELAWTMNWVDRLHTIADKRMWSGRRAVVMRTGRRAEFLGVKLGCPRSRYHAVVSDVLCVRSYVHFVCVCIYMCMCVCVRT